MVAPDRRTTAFIHWDLMPSRLNASNCSSPEGKASTMRRNNAPPSDSVRYMVRPSAIISVGRSPRTSASHAGSVTEPDTTW
jgi:hypothetical protein